MAGATLDKVTKRYGDTVALSDIDLGVGDGEFVAIFGPPGAGKSTLLKLVAGIETPDSGSITIDGREVTNEAPQRRNVTMAFESYALYPHFSVRGNLEFPLKAPGRQLSQEERSNAIDQVARLLEIDQLLDRRPYELSGGQRQRVALGRALVRKASVTLLDEPIAHLDARLRNALRAELRHFQRDRGATTLYATPDYSEAFGVADRIAVLVDGRLEQFDTPRRIFDAPLNTRVAALVGDPRMNLVEVSGGSIIDSRGQAHRLSNLGVDQDVVRHVGFRPDDLELLRDGDGMLGEVYVSEPVGFLEVVRVRVGDHLMTLRRPISEHARIGERVHVRPRWDLALAFSDDGSLLPRRTA